MALSAAAQGAVSAAKQGRGQRLDPAVSAELSAQPPATATSAPSSASSATPAAAGAGWQLPDFSSVPSAIPGSSPAVKALVVLAVLIIGIGIYSKMTGKTWSWALQGFAAGTPPAPVSPSATPVAGISTMPTTVAGADTMSRRVAIANPTKVA